jgi:chemotaxis protein MotB
MRQVVTLALIVATISGCGVSQAKYTAKESEAAKYKQHMEGEAGKVIALEQENATLKGQVTNLTAALSESRSKAQATGAQKAQLEATTAQLMGQQSKMLNQQLLFPENSSKLTPEAKRTLDSAADAISQLRDKAVIVAAYTDDSEAGGKAGAAKRWQLSTARAVEVAKYLVSRNYDPKLIGVAGFGESRPVVANDSIANRALNRRVEIILAPTELALKTVEVNPASLQK